MKIMITGASSGIGRDMARYLNKLGHKLILVDIDIEGINKLKGQLNVIKTIKCDLSYPKNCINLYEEVKDENIDMLINNAGFGDIGLFEKTNLDKDLSMINTNIVAMHILTKLFLKDFKLKNSGYILNVSSIAAFQPGPLMATYYATKSYIFNMTMAITEELRQEKSKVYIGVLCPEPTKTNFMDKAQCKFKIKHAESSYVAKYGIDNMLKRRKIIIPTLLMKTSHIFSKILPISLLLLIYYNIQEPKK